MSSLRWSPPSAVGSTHCVERATCFRTQALRGALGRSRIHLGPSGSPNQTHLNSTGLAIRSSLPPPREFLMPRHEARDASPMRRGPHPYEALSRLARHGADSSARSHRHSHRKMREKPATPMPCRPRTGSLVARLSHRGVDALINATSVPSADHRGSAAAVTAEPHLKSSKECGSPCEDELSSARPPESISIERIPTPLNHHPADF
jgi:hypothetical protein